MATFNLNHKDDPFYRYKMPAVTLKYEGKNTRVRTVIVNMTEIAKSMYRSPHYIVKFISTTLGVQMQIDCDGRHMIKGHHTTENIQKLISKFLDKYVLCTKCSNPETILKVASKKVKLLCTACGHSSTYNDQHKFIKYILSHPPSQSDYTQLLKKQKSRQAKKREQNDTHSDDGSFTAAQAL